MLIKSYRFYSYVNIIIVRHAVIRIMHVLGVNCASAKTGYYCVTLAWDVCFPSCLQRTQENQKQIYQEGLWRYKSTYKIKVFKHVKDWGFKLTKFEANQQLFTLPRLSFNSALLHMTTMRTSSRGGPSRASNTNLICLKS